MPTLSMFEGRNLFRFIIVLVLVLLLWNLALLSQQSVRAPGSELESSCGVEDAKGGSGGKGKEEEEMQIPLLSTIPSTSFRHNLRPDTKYVTTWPSNGWTNDVMAYCNMILLGLMSDRVPILPRFAPTHVGNDAGFIPVSEIFDLKRLGKLIGTPILEWDMLKNYTRENLEDLGCWGTHPTLFNGNVLRTTTELQLGLDISYTAVPTWAHINHDMNLIKVNFIALVGLSYPKTRAEAIAKPPYPPFPARSSGNVLPPDDQLECFDYTYDLGMHEGWEWTYEWSPAWKQVGRHMYFAPWLVEVTQGMVKRALGIPEADEIPPLITLHIRRADFRMACDNENRPLEECFASLATYARRVEQVRSELRESQGVDVQHVFVTSDERDKEWWADVRALGWYGIDHDKEETATKYGKWYPVMIDVVAQSFGKGFVGTDRSTVSVVSAKRVTDWNNGVYRHVKWGWPGADDD